MCTIAAQYNHVIQISIEPGSWVSEVPENGNPPPETRQARRGREGVIVFFDEYGCLDYDDDNGDGERLRLAASSSSRGTDRAQAPPASTQTQTQSTQTPVLTTTTTTAAPSSARQTNVFSLVERLTFKPSSTETNLPNPPPRLPSEIQYWAGVIMRNACRKDDSRGGIRQCANSEWFF